MKITIAGYGFVGRAHEEVLKNSHEIAINDPNLGYSNWHSQPDGVIICVSTPPAQDGSCNVDNVIDVISHVGEDVPVLIKSTISLEGWRRIKFMFPNHRLAFSPEFLRAATAITDFKNTRELLVGGESADVLFWHTVFRFAFDGPSAIASNVSSSSFSTIPEDPEVLILAKYFRNAFLATKVNFFNQIYDLCEATGVNPGGVISNVANDARIGYGHHNVTNERGFGGHCFPKDTDAILKTGNAYDVDLTIIKEAVEYNKRIRKE